MEGETQSPSRSVLMGLLDLPSGEPRLATAANVGSVLAQLTRLGPAELNNRRILMVAWRRLPPHSAIVEETLDQLAETARSLWPEWYLAVKGGVDGEGTLEALRERARKAGKEQAVVPRWLQLAEKACRAHRPPRWAHEFTAAVEARQLALVLGERSCQLVLVVLDENHDATALLGLARAAEWLAREANMPLLVVAPNSLANSPEFDSINFLRVEVPGDSTSETESSSSSVDATSPRLIRRHPGSRGCSCIR